MKFPLLFLLALAFSYELYSADEQSIHPTADGIEVTITNNNNHRIEVHNERKDICDCTPFFGEQFKQCMLYVSKDCFKKNIQALDDRVCKKYVADLTMKEITELRASFAEHEWLDLQTTCSLFTQLIDERIHCEKKRKEEYDKDTNKSIALTLIGLLLLACK